MKSFLTYENDRNRVKISSFLYLAVVRCIFTHPVYNPSIYRQIGESNHAELSPLDIHDTKFSRVTSPTVAQGYRMKLLEELRDSLPSSSETFSKLEEAKEKLTTSLHDFTERLNNEPLSSILSEKATKVSEQASIEAEEIVEQVTETLEETREAIQNITQNITLRLVKPPEPGVAQPIANPDPNHQHVDLALSEEIISQNRKREFDEDTVLVPRIKAAVRQFKAEIDADESGDPPISLVSRKAMARIEQFIRNRRAKMQEKLAEKIPDKISEKFDFVKDISIVGGIEKRDESIMEYITSNVPGCDTEDPELKDIMLDSAGTFYNDSFLVDDIDVEDEALLTSNGWTLELTQEKLRMWKKVIPEENLSLYKIFGDFDTISAVEFYNAQVNDQYRSVWDKSVSSLYVVDNITNNREIVYWATKFPFPLQDRDYVFERTHSMDDSLLNIEISNRSITHKSKPESSKFVRVSRYGSKLVIRGKKDLYQV